MADLLPAIGVNGKPIPQSTKKAPTIKKSNGALKPSDSATNAKPVPQGGAGKTSISGLPLTTQVQRGMDKSNKPVYAKPQYTSVSPYEAYSAMDNQGRANLLYQMSQIVGLYAKNDVLASGNAANFIRSQGNAVTFRPEDFTALGKLMGHADLSGETYSQSIAKFVSAPSLASTYFGNAPTQKQISLSNPADLELDLNNKFMDYFNTQVDKKTAKAYSNEIIKAQKAAGGANQLSQVQADNIFQKYVAQNAHKLVDTTLAHPDAKIQPVDQGSFGSTVLKIRSTYVDNHLPVDDKKIYQDALAAIRSPQALQNVVQNIGLKAAQYYPAVAEGIKNGLSVADLLNAPINSYATTFNVPTSRVPQTFLSKVAGGKSILPQEEVDKLVWNSDGIEKTQAYQQMRANDMRTMIQTFGLGPI